MGYSLPCLVCTESIENAICIVKTFHTNLSFNLAVNAEAIPNSVVLLDPYLFIIQNLKIFSEGTKQCHFATNLSKILKQLSY